jgi:hypothetical protein
MATHPYISGAGNVSQMIVQLRKSFPATVTSETVKKLGLAPNNETYVINTLQFIGIIDAEGKKTSVAASIFSKHKDEDFASAFEDVIKKAYSGLFELHADHTWKLSDEDLITFFRQSDQTSEAIGRRQANTFKVLAALAGHGEAPSAKAPKAKMASGGAKKKVEKKATTSTTTAGVDLENKNAAVGSGKAAGKDFGLSVRIEINLPADGTKETYDNIFKSIRENLLNG